MSAEEHLNPAQFRHPGEIGYMESRDYSGKIGDLEFRPGGDSDKRVREIMGSAQSEGIREPLVVQRGGAGMYLHDGHHRYVAAKRLGINVPVQYPDDW